MKHVLEFLFRIALLAFIWIVWWWALITQLSNVMNLSIIAGGVWFLQDHIFIIAPEIFKNFYWPAVIVIVGLSFILSSLFKRKN